MKFTTSKRSAFTLLQVLCMVAIIGILAALLLPQARAIDLYQTTRTTTLTNVPQFVAASAFSGATITPYTALTNAAAIRQGKGIALSYTCAQATNGTTGTITNYYGLGFNATNNCSTTNVQWIIQLKASTALERYYTNLPATVTDNANYIFWYGTHNGHTNTLITVTNNVHSQN